MGINDNRSKFNLIFPKPLKSISTTESIYYHGIFIIRATGSLLITFSKGKYLAMGPPSATLPNEYCT